MSKLPEGFRAISMDDIKPISKPKPKNRAQKIIEQFEASDAQVIERKFQTKEKAHSENVRLREAIKAKRSSIKVMRRGNYLYLVKQGGSDVN